MSDEIRLSEELEGLIQDALEHALSSVSEGDPLVPFVVFERDGERDLRRFLVQGEDPDRWDVGASVEEAKAFAAGLAGKADRAALAVDGRIVHPEDGRAVDCIFIDAFEEGDAHACRIGQCYAPPAEGSEFGLVDDPMLLSVDDPMW